MDLSTKSSRLHAVRDEVLRARERAVDHAGRPSVAEWYAGANVFMTGGSGFLGRALVELLLRSCPDIGSIYILMRPKKGVASQDRLATLLDVSLFDRLRAEQPNALSKVKAVPGDTGAPSLGLSDADRKHLCSEVSVVFHVAASVRFDDPLQQAVRSNIRSSFEVVQLCRDMPGLKVLVHVSTAYTFINQHPIDECVYPNHLDWKEVLRYADLPASDQIALDALGPKLRQFQPNTYTFTKALSESLMEEAAKELPVIITRPSIVMASHSDPMPGWIDNLNGLAGFVAGVGTGFLRCVAGPDIAFDSIPVDVAAKLIVLASWTRGLGLQLSKRPVDVVNVTVGTDVGLHFAECTYMDKKYGINKHLAPYPQAIRPPGFQHEKCPVIYAIKHFYHHLVYGFVLDLLSKAVGKQPRALHLYRKVVVSLCMTKPFRKEVSFIMENRRKLMSMIHPSDLKTLDFLDIFNTRDSEEVLLNTMMNQTRGIIRYALQSKEDVEKSRAKMKRLELLMPAYHSAMAFLFFGFLTLIWKMRQFIVNEDISTH